MAKRRTKKQKQRARHGFTVSWKPQKEKVKSGTKIKPANPSVKRQLPDEPKKNKADIKTPKKARYSGKDENLRTIRQDIIKSLVLAGLIVGLEIVLYLFLRS